MQNYKYKGYFIEFDEFNGGWRISPLKDIMWVIVDSIAEAKEYINKLSKF